MKFKFVINFLVLSIATSSYGQFDFWGSGQKAIGQVCSKSGLLALLPMSRCNTQGGSVSCKTNALGIGLCTCNQGSSAIVDDGDNWGKCVGLVGAICTAEKTNFIPEKFCTANAECVPEQGEGYSVGRCRCLYGFKESDNVETFGKCIPDEDIEEGDRSTPRTTTTTEAPDRGDFQLPPLASLIAPQFATFGQECQTKALLKRTFCNTHGGTVSCQNRRCLCNMGDDSVFDEELKMCVGRIGTRCLNKRSLFGYKICASGAHCVVAEGAGYSLGECQCLDGYITQPDGTCMRDPDIPNPSTASTIMPLRTSPKVTTTGLPGDGDSGAGRYSSSILSIALVSVFAILQI